MRDKEKNHFHPSLSFLIYKLYNNLTPQNRYKLKLSSSLSNNIHPLHTDSHQSEPTDICKKLIDKSCKHAGWTQIVWPNCYSFLGGSCLQDNVLRAFTQGLLRSYTVRLHLERNDYWMRHDLPPLYAIFSVVTITSIPALLPSTIMIILLLLLNKLWITESIDLMWSIMKPKGCLVNHTYDQCLRSMMSSLWYSPDCTKSVAVRRCICYLTKIWFFSIFTTKWALDMFQHRDAWENQVHICRL